MDNRAFRPDDGPPGRTPFAPQNGPRPTGNDYLVEVNSRAKLYKKPEFYKKLSACLLLLAIIFFITTIVFVTLYSSSPRRRDVCATPECVRAAHEYRASMDVGVDPCVDFYGFACGRWTAAHPTHQWWRTFSSFTRIAEAVALASADALKKKKKKKGKEEEEEPEALRKSRDFYGSCTDVDKLNELGVAVVFPILKKLHLPAVPTFITNGGGGGGGGGKKRGDPAPPADFRFDWLKSDALTKNTLLMDVFIGATVGPNIYNGSENVLYIGTIYQTSPLPSPLKKIETNRRRRTAKRRKEAKDEQEEEEEEENRKEEEELSRTVNGNIMKYLMNEIIANKTGSAPDPDLLNRAADIIIDMSDYIDEIVTNATDADEGDTYARTVESLQTEIADHLRTERERRGGGGGGGGGTPGAGTNLKKSFLVDYLNEMFEGAGVGGGGRPIATADLVYVTAADVRFLKTMTAFAAETSEAAHVELYAWWAAVYAVAAANAGADVSAFVAAQLAALGGAEEEEEEEEEEVLRSRSLECALLVNNYMGYAVSYALADRAFPNVTKPKVERMVEGLKEAFRRRVAEIPWMDAATKKATLEKNEETIAFIGYPDWLFRPGELDQYYRDVTVTKDAYLSNMISVVEAHSKRTLASLRAVHARDWYSEPIEVNAFNSFSDNAINVPMAILNFPMYHLGLEVLNYGSIGSILGHELTHGFDNVGRKHDKYGNYVQWWTNETIEAFENLTRCFVEQYENFTIPGVEGHVDGKSTLGENLADNGGLNQAYAAYEKYVEKYGEEPTLPGFENYDNFQLFFIAYANIWCETTNPSDLGAQIRYDEHAPNSIRVLGNLRNSEEFAERFRCAPGSPMNPRKKCRIW